MPLEALALALDMAGVGAPVWWLTARALDLLLWLAHVTASAPGAVAALPAMPGGAYALIVAGGLWIALWRTRLRWAGAAPFALGLGWALLTPPPDLLVTGDGRHLAIRMASGEMALLRDRAGDYTRAMLGENSGAEETQLALLSEAPAARCSPDLCLVEVVAGARRWRVLATRSGYLVPWREMIAACSVADVVVSERRLPPGCTPRWLKLDRDTLTKTGGVAIRFGDADIRTVRGEGKHPWFDPLTVQPPYAARQGDRQDVAGSGRGDGSRALSPGRGSILDR
jgi:competence protein ComEC